MRRRRNPRCPSSQRPDVIAEFAEQQSALLAAVSALPQEQREAFLLHEETGLTIEEIARVTDVGVETAKSRLRYAVRKLKKSLLPARFPGRAAGTDSQCIHLTTWTNICAATARCRVSTGGNPRRLRRRRSIAACSRCRGGRVARRFDRTARPAPPRNVRAASAASPCLAPLAFAASVLTSVALVLAIVFGPQSAKRVDDAPRVVRVVAHARAAAAVHQRFQGSTPAFRVARGYRRAAPRRTQPRSGRGIAPLSHCLSHLPGLPGVLGRDPTLTRARAQQPHRTGNMG